MAHSSRAHEDAGTALRPPLLSGSHTAARATSSHGLGSLPVPVTANERPISNNTLNAALRRLGYTGNEMVSHGFRSMASTCLNEQGWHPDLIELQLAHAERDEVRGAYNRAQRLDERRKMMQAWSEYLDGLRAGAKVIPIRASA